MSGILAGCGWLKVGVRGGAAGRHDLAQLGADVIRFDQIGGGLDYHRWPRRYYRAGQGGWAFPDQLFRCADGSLSTTWSKTARI